MVIIFVIIGRVIRETVYLTCVGIAGIISITGALAPSVIITISNTITLAVIRALVPHTVVRGIFICAGFIIEPGIF